MKELVYLIPELCFITGLDDSLTKNFTLMNELAKHTEIAPRKRKEAVQKYVDLVNSKIILCFA